MNGTEKTIALIKSLAGKVDPSTIQSKVEGWLDDHPEATTTVLDGSITEAKLDNNLQGKMADVADLKSAMTQNGVEELLLRDELPGTITTVTMDSNGNPTSIVHSADGETVRTDVFVWSDGSVVETRTSTDYYITITTNLETLTQTISEVQEVA